MFKKTDSKQDSLTSKRHPTKASFLDSLGNSGVQNPWPETWRRVDTHRTPMTPFEMACIITAQAVKQYLTWKPV